MVKASRGLRHQTRKKLKKRFRVKSTVTPFLKEFKVNDQVVIEQNPISHKGMPHPRFKGLVGIIKDKKGKSYIIKVKVGNKTKEIIAKGEHLKPIS